MLNRLIRIYSPLLFIVSIISLSQAIAETDSTLSFRLYNNGIIRDSDSSWIALNSSQKEIISIHKSGVMKKFQLVNAINPVAIAKDRRNYIIFDKEKNSISRYNSRMEFIEEVYLPDDWKFALTDICLVSSKSEYLFFNKIKSELVATNQNGFPTWKKFIPIQEPLFCQKCDTTIIVGKRISDSNEFSNYLLLKISSFGSYTESKQLDLRLKPISIHIDEQNSIHILTSNAIITLWSDSEPKVNWINHQEHLRSFIVNKSDILLYSIDSVYIFPNKMNASDR